MRKLIIILVFLTACSATKTDDVAESNKTLIFGDSWAFLTHHHAVVGGNVIGLTKSGSTAKYWASAEGQALMSLYFAQGVGDVRKVMFSIGGNDLMGKYKTSNTSEENAIIYSEITANSLIIFQRLSTAMPDAIIVTMGLDYPNFDESRNASIAPSVANSYWKKTGEPTALEFNTMLGDFYKVLKVAIDTQDKWKYSHNLGMMQYTADPSLPSPDDVWLAGNPDEGTPAEFMEDGSVISELLSIGVYVDSIHLNKAGYAILSKRALDGI